MDGHTTIQSIPITHTNNPHSACLYGTASLPFLKITKPNVYRTSAQKCTELWKIYAKPSGPSVLNLLHEATPEKNK